jgi:uncharacterized LabA/DUF88 family protein
LAETRLKIAVFIDFDNIEIGVKSTLGQHFDVGAVLEAIKERGEVVTKVAYGDWTRAGDYSRSLTQHAIHMVQRNLTPGGDKNGADINLALDALEMAFTHSHINAFVIVGGDSDFMALVEKLKQYDRKVFVVGGRAFTSIILQRNCTEFIAYENLVNVSSAMPRKAGGRGKAEVPVTQAVALVRRALKVLSDREVSPQLGVLKSTLLQLDSTFSEREYGASTFRDFVQRLARAGYVTLKGTDRNIYVELREGGDGSASASGGALPAAGGKDGDPGSVESGVAADGGVAGAIDVDVLPPPQAQAGEITSSGGATPAGASGGSDYGAEPASRAVAGSSQATGSGGFAASAAGATNGTASHQTASVAPQDVAVSEAAGTGGGPAAAGSPQAEGARFITEVFHRPGIVSRWPLYLRQVKQILRSVDEAFDERRYGFQGLVEALRYCQREGLFRLDRDRQGVLRVYPGSALPRAVASPGQSAEGSTVTPPAGSGDRHRSGGRAHAERPEATEASVSDAAGSAEMASGDLFAEAADTRTSHAHVADQAESGSDADVSESIGAMASAAAAESDASGAPGVEASEVDAAVATADAGGPAAPPVRGSRRRRPGAIAAKSAAKKTAATPKTRGAKSARPRKAAKNNAKEAS